MTTAIPGIRTIMITRIMTGETSGVWHLEEQEKKANSTEQCNNW